MPGRPGKRGGYLRPEMGQALAGPPGGATTLSGIFMVRASVAPLVSGAVGRHAGPSASSEAPTTALTLTSRRGCRGGPGRGGASRVVAQVAPARPSGPGLCLRSSRHLCSRPGLSGAHSGARLGRGSGRRVHGRESGSGVWDVAVRAAEKGSSGTGHSRSGLWPTGCPHSKPGRRGPFKMGSDAATPHPGQPLHASSPGPGLHGLRRPLS